jgi:exosortase
MASERLSGPAAKIIGPQFRGPVLWFAGLLLALVYSYWSTLLVMADKWHHDPQYSHGWLVPAFAVYLLWMRREQMPALSKKGSSWGLALLIVAAAIRLLAAFFYYEWFDFLSLIPAVAGLTLLCFGSPVLRWSLPATLFLAFMIPLPYSIETAMRQPLQKVGTVASTYVMQTVGLPAFREGNTILVNDTKIGVVEACSGLRMLMIFFALATAVAMLSKKALWERLVIVASAVPIAIIANVARITVTGILYETAGPHLAELVFHDLAGWLMMPFGLLLLWLELELLTRLFVVEQEVPLTPLAQLGLGLGMAAKPVAAGPGSGPARADSHARKSSVS